MGIRNFLEPIEAATFDPATLRPSVYWLFPIDPRFDCSMRPLTRQARMRSKTKLNGICAFDALVRLFATPKTEYVSWDLRLRSLLC